MMKKVPRILAVLPLLFLACEDEYNLCPTNPVNFIGAFYTNAGGTEQTTNAPQLSVTQVGSPVALYSNAANAPKVSLALDPTKSSVSWQIVVDNTKPADTITASYTTVSVAAVGDCQTSYEHTVTSVSTTTNTLQSVSLIRGLVNRDPQTNFKILF